MDVIKVKNDRTSTYDIDEIFLKRWSPRSFSEKQVPEETLLALFEAAHWAPSALSLRRLRRKERLSIRLSMNSTYPGVNQHLF